MSAKKLKPEVKKLWLEALRSGDYKQGRGQLRSENDTFCCLGVLCNIHAQQHPKFAATQKVRGVYDGDHAFLGPTVWKWAFDENSKLTGIVLDSGYTLVELNDAKKLSFVQIAKEIETYL